MVRVRAFTTLLAMAGVSLQVSGQDHFSEAERNRIVSYWAEPGRHSVRPAGPVGSPWQPRQTPEGSAWIHEVYKALQPGKVDPKRDLVGATPEHRAWTSWIELRYAADELWAAAECLKLNLAQCDPASGGSAAAQKGQARFGVTDVSPKPPPELPPCPAGLLAVAGPPPRFVAPVRPESHTVVFEDGTVLHYETHVRVRRKYAYYRFAEGVMSAGTPVSALGAGRLALLSAAAGISPRDLRVMSAVSTLEGGFDSVNTYDTGLVSVGLIQFACLTNGRGALGQLLRSYKMARPEAFEDDFRRFGIDVDHDGALVVVDPSAGRELRGPEAAHAVIRDKRLTAVFQRAGRSEPFQITQLRSAHEQFFPANEVLNLNLGGIRRQIKVGDVFRSEAGLATLMDRKVNTGHLRDVSAVVESLASQFGISSEDRLPEIEHLAVRRLRYRSDFLAANDLTQPRGTARVLTSRSGARTERSRPRPKK